MPMSAPVVPHLLAARVYLVPVVAHLGGRGFEAEDAGREKVLEIIALCVQYCRARIREARGRDGSARASAFIE